MWKPQLNVEVKFASKKMGIGTNLIEWIIVRI